MIPKDRLVQGLEDCKGGLQMKADHRVRHRTVKGMLALMSIV